MKHCIIVKYTPDISAEKKTALIPEIKSLFERTTEIDGIHSVKLYPNCVPRENRYDLMIEISMEPYALEAYDCSEPHMIWKRDYASVIEKKAIFDRE